MKWRPTHKENLITALRMVGAAWESCLMHELQPGDIFRAVDVDGEFVDPTNGEHDPFCVARVVGHPIKNEPGVTDCPGQPLGVGYGVPVNVYPSMDDLKRKGLS